MMLLVPLNWKFGSIQFPSNFTRPRTYQRVSALNAFVSGLRNRRVTIGSSGHFSFRGRSKDQWDNPTPISIKNLGIRAKNEETNKESKAKSKTSMGRLFIETLRGPKIFKCRFCKVDSASHDAIVSKDFQGRYGKAYLFRNVVNISLGPIEERHLISGLHTVNDIYCSSCQQILGWRYEKAYEPSQKYKEGKYILERDRILKESW